MIYASKVTPEFCAKVEDIAAKLGIDPDWLMACMEFESGLNPAAKNPKSSASGLIQFMAATAKNLGTTTMALRKMSGEAQLEYVERYFRPWRGKLKTLGDVYMAILWPRAVGKSDSYALFVRGEPAYAVNKGLDKNGDGYVTKAEAAAKVIAAYQRGLKA